MKDHLEEAKGCVEEANRLLGKGRMHARAASKLDSLGEYAGLIFPEFVDSADDKMAEYAEAAIDAYKDAYFEAYRAQEVIMALEDSEDLENDLESGGMLESISLEASSQIGESEIDRLRSESENIMDSLETRYGDSLDFQGYVDKILDE